MTKPFETEAPSRNSDKHIALEILKRVGFSSPAIGEKPNQKLFGAETFEKKYYELGKVNQQEFIKIKDLKEKGYELDVTNQVIIDLKTRQKYKISGNLFASKLGAILVDDSGFNPEESGISLVKRGDRFFAFFTELKEAKFTQTNYYETIENEWVKKLYKAELYKNTPQEQELYILNQISSIPINDLEKIFSNPKVLNSESLHEKDLKTKCENFKKTVSSVITTPQTDPNANLLDFLNREKIRKQLANSVIERLRLPKYFDKKALETIILEDLRAPYYKQHFLNKEFVQGKDLENKKLIGILVQDQAKELNALGISTLPGLLENIKGHIASEIERLNEVKSSIKKKKLLEKLLFNINENQDDFCNNSIEAQKRFINKIINHLDIIAHYHCTRFFLHWHTPTSEKNWLAFKRKYAAQIHRANPSLMATLLLRKAGITDFSTYCKFVEEGSQNIELADALSLQETSTPRSKLSR